MIRFLSTALLLFACSAALEPEAEARDVREVDIAAGTVHTNSTDEAVLASEDFAAYSFRPGTVYEWSGCVRATDNNSTDTLTVVGRIGSTALAGTAIFTSGAVDVADNDLITWDVTVVARSTTSLLVYGSATILGAEGTVTRRAVFEIVTIDSTAAVYFGVTGDWSVAHADNDVQAEGFTIYQRN